MLDALFPAQHSALLVAYDASLAAIPNGAPKSQGVAVGTMAAAAMLAEHREPSQFRTAGPYPLASAAYAADVIEVEAVGSIGSATRTAAQTHAAAFWQTNPSANYNAMGRRFADQLGLDLSDSARLFALLDLSSADALTAAWERQGLLELLATDERDPPCGHRRQCGHDGGPVMDAVVRSVVRCGDLRSRSGSDHAAVPRPSVGSDGGGERCHACVCVVLRHRRDAVLCHEVLEARIWAGIHFRNADVQAATLGGDAERYIHTHYFAAAH